MDDGAAAAGGARAGRRIAGPVDCVLFDLDDTLYEQTEFLRGAFRDAAAAHAAAAAAGPLAAAMLDVVREDGTEGGRIFERALERLGRAADDAALARMAAAFRAHAPARLAPAPGVDAMLAALAARFPLGLVTDGDEVVQRAKLRALGLERHFRAVVYSDSLGGPAARKPNAAPFRAALARLGARAAHSVHVGDHPGRDVAGARALGMITVRVRTGEHRAVATGAVADHTIGRLDELLALLRA